MSDFLVEYLSIQNQNPSTEYVMLGVVIFSQFSLITGQFKKH